MNINPVSTLVIKTECLLVDRQQLSAYCVPGSVLETGVMKGFLDDISQFRARTVGPGFSAPSKVCQILFASPQVRNSLRTILFIF